MKNHPPTDPSLRPSTPSHRFIVCILLFTTLSGCVGPWKQWGAETSLVSRPPDFEPTRLEQNRAAVISAVVSFGFEGYAHQISRSLFKALTMPLLRLSVLSPQMTLSRINRGDLAKEYSEMMSAYQQSGILNRGTLARIGELLQTPYAFLPTMAWFDQAIVERFNFFGMRLLQTRVSILRLSVEIWDARTGEIAWEVSGEATLAGEDVREYRIPFEEIAQHLWGRLLEDLHSTRPVPSSSWKETCPCHNLPGSCLRASSHCSSG